MKYAIAAVVVIAVIALGFLFMPKDGTQTPLVVNQYENEVYGIAFSYPEGFTLSEAEVGNAERGHYAITIVRTEDAVPRENSEGPVAVTIDIYQNNLDQQSLNGWMTGSNESNFKFGPGTYATTSVDGTESATYRWSGLYTGETTAFIHKDAIIAVSVTSLAPTDETISAYQMVLNTFKLK